MHGSVQELIARCGGVACGRVGPGVGRAAAEAAPSARAREFVTRLAVEPIEIHRHDGEPDARYADAVLARVEELAVSREIARIKSRLQRLSPVDEAAAYNRMFGDRAALEQRARDQRPRRRRTGARHAQRLSTALLASR